MHFLNLETELTSNVGSLDFSYGCKFHLVNKKIRHQNVITGTRSLCGELKETQLLFCYISCVFSAGFLIDIRNSNAYHQCFGYDVLLVSIQ